MVFKKTSSPSPPSCSTSKNTLVLLSSCGKEFIGGAGALLSSYMFKLSNIPPYLKMTKNHRKKMNFTNKSFLLFLPLFHTKLKGISLGLFLFLCFSDHFIDFSKFFPSCRILFIQIQTIYQTLPCTTNKLKNGLSNYHPFYLSKQIHLYFLPIFYHTNNSYFLMSPNPFNEMPILYIAFTFCSSTAST